MPVNDGQSSRRGVLDFGGRIILIVLAILALSQALGTFLSVMSFEKIYLKALITKYEILGKDTKRKIEQSLKFGKPLNRFMGMDRLVMPIFQLSDDLHAVLVTDPAGNVLFSSGKAEFIVAKGGDESENPQGKILLGEYKTQKTSPAAAMFDWEKKGSVILQHEKRYYIMLPIQSPSNEREGILALVFNKSVVDEKKRELLISTRTKLIFSIGITALAIGLLIQVLFVSPARRQVLKLSQVVHNVKGGPDSLSADAPRELHRIRKSIEDFITHAEDSKKELSVALDGLKGVIGEDEGVAYEIERMKRITDGAENEED